MKRLYLLLLLLCGASFIQAATWHLVEGKYAYVEYTTDNKEVADSLLEIAEMAIPRLAKMTGVPLQSFLDKKTRIILTDAPDVTNGYAIGNTVVIYALSSGFALSWSNNDSWYKTVLTHELSHHTVFRASHRKLSVLGSITDMSVPRWFHEGVAQYFAETWNAFRGDIFLKNAVLSGQLSYDAIDNWTDGAILYSAGHAFVRWLAWQFGDSSLINLLRFEPDGWMYDFDEAFEHVYKKTPESLFAKFLRYMIIYYGDRLAAYPAEADFERMSAKNIQIFDLLPYDKRDSTYIVTAKLDPIHLYRTALMARLKNKKEMDEVYTITNNFDTDLFISPNKRFAAYGRYSLSTIHNQTGIRLDWFVHDLQKKTTMEIASDTRARSVVLTNNGRLILAQTLPQKSLLLQYTPGYASPDTLLTTAMSVGYLSALDSARIVFDAQKTNGWHDLFLLSVKSGQLLELTNDSLVNRRPLALNDSIVVFNRIVDKNQAIATINLHTKKVSTHINDQYAYWLKNYDRETGQLIVSRWESKRKAQFFTISADTLLRKRSEPDLASVNPRYISWEHKTPSFGHLGALPDTAFEAKGQKGIRLPQFKMIHLLSGAIPFYAGKETGWGALGMTAWADPLQRQIFQLTLYADQRGWNSSLLLAGHVLRAWDQIFTTTYYHGPAIFAFENDTYLETYQDIFSFGWSHPWNPGGNSRTQIMPSLSYTAYHYNIKATRPYLPQTYSYQGPSAYISFRYILPTRYGAALYKRYAYGRINYFQSLTPAYKFNLVQADVHLAGNIFWEELGLKTRANYTVTSGKLPPLNRMGIDRFFGIDVPRDLTYTRTVRGVREDLSAREMFWSSVELTYMLAEKSGMKLLFLPVNLLTFTAFYDYALLENDKIININGYGAEMTFGWNILRLGLGYAIGTNSTAQKTQEWYMRVILGTGF